jgi:hypothetical protein
MMTPPTPIAATSASFSATVAGEPWISECCTIVRAAGAVPGGGIGTIDTPCSRYTCSRIAERCVCIASNAGTAMRSACASVSATNTLRHTQHCSTLSATAASSSPISRSVRRYSAMR